MKRSFRTSQCRNQMHVECGLIARMRRHNAYFCNCVCHSPWVAEQLRELIQRRDLLQVMGVRAATEPAAEPAAAAAVADQVAEELEF